MKSIKKNAVILTVMLFICAAVYLNWSYNKEVEGASASGDKGKVTDPTETGPAATRPAGALVSEGGAGLYYTVAGTQDGKTDADASADAAKKLLEEYFADVRLKRGEARDEAAATLSAVASADGASQETVDGALKAMTQLADRAVKEAEIESKIKAKGFIDCVVYLTDERVSVTVAAEGGLDQSAVAKITDIVIAETGLTADKLTVSEIK